MKKHSMVWVTFSIARFFSIAGFLTLSPLAKASDSPMMDGDFFSVLVRMSTVPLFNQFNGSQVNSFCVIDGAQKPLSECADRISISTLILNQRPASQADSYVATVSPAQAESDRILRCSETVVAKFYPYAPDGIAGVELCKSRTDIYPPLNALEKQLIADLTPSYEFDPNHYDSLVFDQNVPQRTEKIPLEQIVDEYSSVLGRYPSRIEVDREIELGVAGIAGIAPRLQELLKRLQIEDAFIRTYGRASTLTEFNKYLIHYNNSASIASTQQVMQSDLEWETFMTNFPSILIAVNSIILN